MRNRAVSVIVVTLFVFTLVIAGCTKGNNEGKASDSGKPSSPATSSTSPSAKPDPTADQKLDLTMVMSNSGLTYPEKVDPSDNEFINVVKDYANVNLNLKVEKNGEVGTWLPLLLASNKLPDILHTPKVDVVNEAAEKGAFIDLKPFYDNSPEIQKWITPEMMDMASYNGHYYRLPMATGKDAPQGGGNYVRMDLLEKFNDGKYPDTVEGYVEVLRKIKAANPNAIPLSAWADPSAGTIFNYGQGFFQWYGARPNEFRVQDGHVLSTFVLPEYRAAVELYRQLYSEGLLDKDFATNDWTAWFNNLDKDVLIVNDTADQLLPLAAYHKQSKGTPTDTSFRSRIAFAPPLASYPSVVKDPKYTLFPMNSPIVFHGLYISSSSKHPERAWKVLEGFASDQMAEKLWWGDEGKEYVVKDGKRIPDAVKLNDPDRYWSLQLSIVRGFAAGIEAKNAIYLQVLGQEDFDLSANSLKYPAEMAEEAGYNMFTLLPFTSLDKVKLKLTESNIFLSGATVEAITGKISMEQFDKKVEEYKSKYGFIGEEYTKYMNENKAQLEGWGVKQINW